MDSIEEKEPGEPITIGDHQVGDSQEATLICADCRTSKTPLWRGGPSGPKSLCNACGIRYRKKRRELLRLNDGVQKESKKDKKTFSDDSGGGDGGGKMSVLSTLGFGPELWLKQRSLQQLRRRRRLGEEEEAAVLLMALSSGLIYSSMQSERPTPPG
ncbi:GATA transcription factor 16 [Zostera marina]|uniref:GATA transcription factor 16 n=1 Tax=Zostera marina TaxID=29655 RepID=A0A0K9P390_ZOSMR|nr:GATA transcription factor 16 [Zostera marina]